MQLSCQLCSAKFLLTSALPASLATVLAIRRTVVKPSRCASHHSNPQERQPWKTNRCGADARDDILLVTKKLERAIGKRWIGYDRRSLVEIKIRCFKLLGERIMARDFDRQVAELQVRATMLNRFTRPFPSYGPSVLRRTKIA